MCIDIRKKVSNITEDILFPIFSVFPIVSQIYNNILYPQILYNKSYMCASSFLCIHKECLAFIVHDLLKIERYISDLPNLLM